MDKAQGTPAATVTVAGYVFRRLVQLGVTDIFGVPGDFSLAMLDELEAFDDLNWVGAASELGAAYLADGYARARGLGVLATTFGVGELGAAGGVAGSMAEDVPIFHVVSAPPTRAMASGSLVHHTLADGDHARFLRIASEITRTQHVVSAATAAEDIDVALAAWLQTRQPTYLLIPQDISGLRIPSTELGTRIPEAINKSGHGAELDAIFQEFFEEHPHAVAIAGHLVARWSQRQSLVALIQRGVRTVTLPNSKGIVDESSPGYLGVYNGKLCASTIRDAVESEDGRVLIGCTLADTTTGGLSHRFAEEATLVVSRDGVRWRDRVVEGVSFPHAVDALVKVWPVTEGRPVPPLSPCLTALDRAGDSATLTQDQLWASIAAELSEGLRLFADTGTSHFGALDIVFPDDTVFEPATVWSAIGYALPAAIGAAIADPARRVVAVVGDGATQLVAQELAVIDRRRLNPIVVLVNNDGYTVERVIRGPQAAYNDIGRWDWALVPRALGVPEASMSVVSARDADAFGAAFTRALSEPACAHFIEVVTGALDTPPTLTAMAAMLRAKAARTETR